MGIEKKINSWNIKKNKKILDLSFISFVNKKTERILKKFIEDKSIRKNYSISISELTKNAIDSHIKQLIKEFPSVEINEYKDNVEIIILSYGETPSLEEVYEREKKENITNLKRTSRRGIFIVKELIGDDFKLNNIQKNSKPYVEAKLYYRK